MNFWEYKVATPLLLVPIVLPLKKIMIVAQMDCKASGIGVNCPKTCRKKPRSWIAILMKKMKA